jgi:hypothetical protein
MSWKPDSEFERLVGVTITGRREAMSQRQVLERKQLDARLSARGVLNSGMRLKGHTEIDSQAFDDLHKALSTMSSDYFAKCTERFQSRQHPGFGPSSQSGSMVWHEGLSTRGKNSHASKV